MRQEYSLPPIGQSAKMRPRRPFDFSRTPQAQKYRYYYIYRVKNVLLILVGRLGCSATFSVPASLASRGRYHFGNAYDMI